MKMTFKEQLGRLALQCMLSDLTPPRVKGMRKFKFRGQKIWPTFIHKPEDQQEILYSIL